MERVIPLFIRKIRQGEPITVFGKEKVLDFTYVDDCVAGVTKALELIVKGDVSNHTINLAYGQGNTLATMAEYVAEELGVTPEIQFEPARIGEVTHYVANIGKARALLDYTPTTPLREGIHKAVAWTVKWWDEHKMPK
jgi:UDP-glucose 4-epimerase